MPAAIPTLAQAVKSALEGATFTTSEDMLIQRVYVPLISLPALATLTVSVFAKANEIELATRAGTLQNVSVDIGIQKKISGDPIKESANTELDGLMLFVEEVIAAFPLPGTTFGTAQLTKKSSAVIYDAERLLSKEFVSIVSLVFKL